MAKSLVTAPSFQSAMPFYEDEKLPTWKESRKEEGTTVEFSDEYVLCPGVNLPPMPSESPYAAEQPADGRTAGQVVGEEKPTVGKLREKLVPPVLKVNTTSPTQDHFVLLQKWEGIVTHVGTDSFIARLTDLSEKGADEEAEFPIEEVPVSDRDLIVRGAVFYWNIGYLDRVGGQRIRASVIRFRRLPAWTSDELEKARSEAQLTRDLLGWK